MAGPTSTHAVALTGGASQAIAGAQGRYKGIVVRETGAVALTLRVWDSAVDATGTIIDVITLAAGGVLSVTLPDGGIYVDRGIFLERVAGGTYEGSVRTG